LFFASSRAVGKKRFVAHPDLRRQASQKSFRATLTLCRRRGRLWQRVNRASIRFDKVDLRLARLLCSGFFHRLLKSGSEQVSTGGQLACCAGAKKLGFDFGAAQRRILSMNLAWKACGHCNQPGGQVEGIFHGLSFVARPNAVGNSAKPSMSRAWRPLY
jgi:hypothetical protein